MTMTHHHHSSNSFSKLWQLHHLPNNPNVDRNTKIIIFCIRATTINSQSKCGLYVDRNGQTILQDLNGILYESNNSSSKTIFQTLSKPWQLHPLAYNSNVDRNTQLTIWTVYNRMIKRFQTVLRVTVTLLHIVFHTSSCK